MQRLQSITPARLVRALLFVAGYKRLGPIETECGKSNRIDAEAMPEYLKQDLGFIDVNDRRHRMARPPSAFDAARDVFLRRPL